MSLSEEPSEDVAPGTQLDASTPTRSVRRNHVLLLLAVVGPGLLAGLSDDDPAGITTYSVLGAGYGYQLLALARALQHWPPPHRTRRTPASQPTVTNLTAEYT